MATSATIPLTPFTPPSTQGAVPHTGRTTVWDTIEFLMDYLGLDVTKAVPRVARRAIRAALREIANARRWTYLYTHGRIFTNAQYGTGTVAYDHTGGAYERLLTLTGGTWPSWANYGSVRIGSTTYTVDQRIDGTRLTLDDVLNPGADVASGATFALYQDTYTLPEDFVGSDQGMADESWGGMDYVHPSDWLRATRYLYSTSNTPRFYTFRGSPKVPGRLAVSLFPFPDVSRSVDFIYHRRPRPITLDRYQTGTVTVNAAGSGTTTVTGTGTVWTNSMVGSVIRLSNNAASYPTNFDGDSPYAEERNVVQVVSATQITVDETITTSYTGVKHRISDPIDIVDGSILEAFLRCAEMHASLQRSHKDREQAKASYQRALILAKEADSVSFARRVAGEFVGYKLRLADMPRGADLP